MAKREILGLMDCPECGMSGAEVKAQKNGLAYRWCGECNAQYFTRTAEASARLLAKVGAGGTAEPEAKPVTVTEAEPERRSYEGQAKVYADSIKPVPEARKAEPKKPVPEPMPELPKKRGTGNAFLDLVHGL